MTQQFHCWAYTPRKQDWKRHVYPHVHRSTVYNSQDVEAERMLFVSMFVTWLLLKLNCCEVRDPVFIVHAYVTIIERRTWDSVEVFPLPFLLPLCQTLCNSMNCSPPGSSVPGILQARLLEWVAVPSSRGSSQGRDQIYISCTGRQVLYHSSHNGFNKTMV